MKRLIPLFLVFWVLLANAAKAELILMNGLLSIIPPIGLGLMKTSGEIKGPIPIPLVTPIEGEIIAHVVGKSLIKKYERGELEGPIILIGHSYGAIMITRIQRMLFNHNPPIPVAYMGLLDGPNMEPIYGNVAVVDNFRPSHGSIGDRMELDKSFKGSANEITIDHLGHVTFTWVMKTQSRLVDQIMKAGYTSIRK